MDAPTAHPLASSLSCGRRLPTGLWLLLILAVGLGLRLWTIARTEVAARDSIGFIRYALRFENEPFLEVVKTSEQPPGYPLALLVVSWPVRAWLGDRSSATMVLCAQIANALASLLALPALYLLGRELFGRRAGLAAAALFVCLPGWTKVTSDGLTEGVFLCWLAWSLYFAARSLRQPTLAGFFACGLCAGGAYLTRPEGLEVVAAFGVVMVGMQWVRSLRQPWPKAFGQLAALGCGVLLLLGPYAGTIGKLTNKNSGKAVLGETDLNPEGLLSGAVGSAAPVGGVAPLAAFWTENDGAILWWSVRALGKETAQGLHYAVAVLAVVGLILAPQFVRRKPVLAVLAALATLHILLLLRMSKLSGYVSERHTLIFSVIGCLTAGIALIRLAGWCAAVAPRWGDRGWTAALLTGLAILGTVPLAKPLHYNRAGHKEAGQWLATHIAPEDAIYDAFNWAEFYAGRIDPATTQQRPPRVFVILESSDNQHSRLPRYPEAKELAAQGTEVFHAPAHQPREKAKVVVVEVPGSRLPEQFTNGLTPTYRVGCPAASANGSSPPVAAGASD